jgi:hypothetical protein
MKNRSSVVDARKGFVGGRRNAPTQAKTGLEWAIRPFKPIQTAPLATAAFNRFVTTR